LHAILTQQVQIQAGMAPAKLVAGQGCQPGVADIAAGLDLLQKTGKGPVQRGEGQGIGQIHAVSPGHD
jgi:hypothetical protein